MSSLTLTYSFVTTMTSRQHNKSKREDLMVCEAMLRHEASARTALQRTRKVYRLCATPCWVHSAGDGRLSIEGKKVAYLYQCQAFLTFGALLKHVSAAKAEQNPLTISHLCGAERSNCSSPEHLVLEPKSVNDDRVSCQTILLRIFKEVCFSATLIVYRCFWR